MTGDSEVDFRFYRHGHDVVLCGDMAVPEGYVAGYWSPRLFAVRPPGPRDWRHLVWYVLHCLRLFGNREYGALTLSTGGETVHRSMVYPRTYRFQFMTTQDLQVGNTWTHPDHQGRGLATYALHEIVRRAARPGRSFWYVAHRANGASLRVAEKCGFALVGLGVRRPHSGIYLMTQRIDGPT